MAQLLEDDMRPTGVLLLKYMHLSEIGGTQFEDFLFANLKREFCSSHRKPVIQVTCQSHKSAEFACMVRISKPWTFAIALDRP